jgi:hypothetical protein
MEQKTETFIKLIDQAIDTAEHMRQQQQPEFNQQEHLSNVINALQSIKITTQSGQLEPSGGNLTLGLARDVADWIEPLDSPLLKAVGEIEQYYQKHL